MIRKITAGVLDGVVNPALREYAECYVDIERSFAESVEELGLPFAGEEAGAGADESPEGAVGGDAAGQETKGAECPVAACPREGAPALPHELSNYVDNGLQILNDGKSLLAGWQSSACAACRLGVGTETFIISTRCPKQCFFCFNPNQANYDGRHGELHDVVGQLEERYDQGVRYTHIALTGGEPLLHKQQTVEFFKRAKELYPQVHTRLYTSGFGIDVPTLEALRDAGLDEIRFSVKTEDVEWPGAGTACEGTPSESSESASTVPAFPLAIEETLAAMELAVGYIPDVMVEMPVLPDQLELMKALLVRLDAIGVKGINLLELGYPFFNAEEFARRGYLLKPSPYRVLYDYAYAGGLPVQGSERACLQLLAFALEQGLRLGVHYCSMENKHSGEIYLSNAPYQQQYPLYALSPNDYFLKTAKVFGADREPVRRLLSALRVRFQDDPANDFLAFNPRDVALLASAFPDMEVAISYALREQREEGPVLRELRLDLTTSATFDMAADL